MTLQITTGYHSIRLALSIIQSKKSLKLLKEFDLIYSDEAKDEWDTMPCVMKIDEYIRNVAYANTKYHCLLLALRPDLIKERINEVKGMSVHTLEIVDGLFERIVFAHHQFKAYPMDHERTKGVLEQLNLILSLIKKVDKSRRNTERFMAFIDKNSRHIKDIDNKTDFFLDVSAYRDLQSMARHERGEYEIIPMNFTRVREPWRVGFISNKVYTTEKAEYLAAIIAAGYLSKIKLTPNVFMAMFPNGFRESLCTSYEVMLKNSAYCNDVELNTAVAGARSLFMAGGVNSVRHFQLAARRLLYVVCKLKGK